MRHTEGYSLLHHKRNEGNKDILESRPSQK
jgi:hypothetical protein